MHKMHDADYYIVVRAMETAATHAAPSSLFAASLREEE